MTHISFHLESSTHLTNFWLLIYWELKIQNLVIKGLQSLKTVSDTIEPMKSSIITKHSVWITTGLTFHCLLLCLRCITLLDVDLIHYKDFYVLVSSWTATTFFHLLLTYCSSSSFPNCLDTCSYFIWLSFQYSGLHFTMTHHTWVWHIQYYVMFIQFISLCFVFDY